jgi:hypothetical protein
MADEASFGTVAALTRHLHREQHSALGVTLGRLCRSDRDRLRFWDAARIVRNSVIERRYVEGEAERVCVEAAQQDPDLLACIGYVGINGRRPEEFAWLLTTSGDVIDVAWSQHRHVHVLGFYGVVLGNVECANWLPGDHQRQAVGERDSGRQRLAA